MAEEEIFFGNSVVIDFAFEDIPDEVLATARQTDAAEEDTVDLVVEEITSLQYRTSFTPDIAGRWYVFLTATGTNAATQEIYFDVIPLHIFDEGALVPPTVAQVGHLIRARTKDNLGAELGTFTAVTRPTYDQARDLIDMAYGDVTAQTGVHVKTSLASAAQSLVALRTAMLIELSYWPEQVRENRSPYEQYRLLYEERLKGLLAAIEGDTAGSSKEGVDQYGTLTLRSPFAYETDEIWPEPEYPINWTDPFTPAS